jgi:hypothetical protein
MIGICQGQTGFSSPPVFVKDKRSCPQPLLPTGVVSSRSPDRTCPVRPYRERICIRGSSVYSAPSFCVSFRSTAKRDQSFICAYPALREGLHGRLSLGNPPALKQCFRVYREGTPSPAQAGFQQGPAGTRVSRIETAISSHAPGASLSLALTIRPISSFDSWSGCRPIGTLTMDSATFPRNRAASWRLARCPASSPSSIRMSC